MFKGSRWMVGVAALAASVLLPMGVAADRAPALTQAPGVPSDLKPLLAAPASEMRLVVTRYNADRSTLIGDYAGRANAGARGQGGRGAAPGGTPGGAPAAPTAAPERPMQISRGRLT